MGDDEVRCGIDLGGTKIELIALAADGDSGRVADRGGAQRIEPTGERQAERQRNEGNEVMAAVCLLTPSELAEFGERTDEFSQVVLDYRASLR